MTTSTLPPNDILIQILSNFPNSDRRTLLACLLSCRALNSVASIRLYQTIRLSSNSIKSPLYDAKPIPAPLRGPLAKRRGVVGNTGRSRKGQLLDMVKVLELDGRMEGPFWNPKALSLPSLRTLRVDMSHLNIVSSGGGAVEQARYTTLGGLKPTTIVIKHTSFHAVPTLLDELPLATLSRLTRVIYIMEYTDWDANFGRVNGSSRSISAFGLQLWLTKLEFAPSTLITVDIVFWTSAPGLNFSTPSNKYTQMRRPAGQTWLDSYISHLGGEPVLASGKIKFNFVNTGSFDRHAIMADEWDYKEVQEVFREKLLKVIKPEKGKELCFMSLEDWMEDMEGGGVMVGDVLTDEELGPWTAEV